METDISICCIQLDRMRPDLKFVIRRLARDDANFKAICNDYCEAIRAAEALKKSNREENEATSELRKLAEDLLDEALCYVVDHKTSLAAGPTRKESR